MVYVYQVVKLESHGMKQRYSTNDKILNYLTPRRNNESPYFEEILEKIRGAADRIIKENCCTAESISKINFLHAMYELIEESQKEDTFSPSIAKTLFRDYILAHVKTAGISLTSFARSGY